MGRPGFWDDQEKAREVVRELKAARAIVEGFGRVERSVKDASLLLEMAIEEKDEATAGEIGGQVAELKSAVDRLELTSLLSGPEDKLGAVVSIHPGAGGTESQDWAEMLLRLYLRWCERRGYEAQILDRQDAEEAGIKSATVEVKGAYAYGYLKSERGVHRLVRISPFDAQKRRHTSFASVFVDPEIEDDIEIEIDEGDLRIDTYRSSGAGGQHVNKTSSAIRITHLPTNIVVQCQNERSQHRNKEMAMRLLRARLYARAKEEEDVRRAQLESEKRDIAWGSQIRSYVFQPYQQVKDHRTDFVATDVQKVMDGAIDGFIAAWLKERAAAGASGGGADSLAE